MFWGGNLRKRAMKYYRIYPFQWIGRERGKSRRGSPLPVLDKISNETVNTAPLCATLFALFSDIVRATFAPLCVLQNNAQLKYTRISWDKSETISRIFTHEASVETKYTIDFDFDFNVIIEQKKNDLTRKISNYGVPLSGGIIYHPWQNGWLF